MIWAEHNGILITGLLTSETVVEGNYIGINADGALATDANGTAVQGGEIGLSITDAKDSTVGGSIAGAGNVIAGNTKYGISISGSEDTVIQGNKSDQSRG